MGENAANIFNPLTGRAEAIPREALGRAQEAEHARELNPVEVKQAKKESAEASTFDPFEADVAALHSNLRGSLGALGVPLDTGIVGVAGVLGGEEGKKSTRDYLRSLDEKHPYASGWAGLLGTVGGSVAAAEMMGGPGAVSKAAAPGLSGFAQRAAMAGAENVVQSTTKDIGEATLGDRAVNGEKLVVSAPGRFLFGAALGGAGEGIFHGLGAAYRGIAKRATPAIEGGINSAVGAEVGDAAAGARVRELSRTHAGVEIPRSRQELADILGAERGAQRGRAVAEHAGTLDALSTAHLGEESGMALRHAGGRAGVSRAGTHSVETAERAGAESTLEAMAAGGARVEEAELSRAAQRTAAGREATRTNFAAARELGGAGEALHAEMASAGRAVDEVAEHYRLMKTPIESELRAARQVAGELAAERASNSEALVREIERGAKYESRKLTSVESKTIADIEASEAAREAGEKRFAKDFEATRRANSGPPPEDNGLLAQLKELNKTVEERSIGGSTEASSAHIDRLRKLGAGIDSAHENALEHVAEIEKSIVGIDSQAAKHMAEVGRVADARVASFQSAQGSTITKAEKVANAALERVRVVEAETAAAVEKARGLGQKEAAAAEKKASVLVEKAKVEAAKAHSDFEKAASKERDAMSRLHAKQVKAVPAPSGITDVDPLIHGMAGAAAAPKGPIVSGSAALGAGLSLLHGNPVAAGAALASSFAAGRLRGTGNLMRARALRAISDQITKVDNAVRDGAALILGRAVGKAAAVAVDEHGRGEKTPAAFDKISSDILNAQANPDLLERQVRASLGELSNHAPETYAGALLTTQRAHAFLLSVLPQPQVDPHSLTPQLDKGSVSETEKYEFMQSYATINDPLSIFKDVHANRVTEQQVDALGTVYPPLYDQIRGEVDMQRSQLAHPIDYERAIHVGTLLGVMTDQVLEPDFQSILAATYEDKTKAAAPKGSKPASGDKMTKSMQSASEKVEGGASNGQ